MKIALWKEGYMAQKVATYVRELVGTPGQDDGVAM